jgi:hypothetical protein
MERWVLPVPVPPISASLRWSATKPPVARSLTTPSLTGLPVKSNSSMSLARGSFAGGHLVADGSLRFLGALGLQQVSHDTGRFILSIDACGHDLVIGASHPAERADAHQVQDWVRSMSAGSPEAVMACAVGHGFVGQAQRGWGQQKR